MASPGFSAEDVVLLRQKLTDDLPLTRDDRRRLIDILDAVTDTPASGSRRTTLSEAEIGNAELRDLLTQFLDAFTPGNSPGSVTQINIFSKISPGGDPGKGGPPPPPPPPPPKISPAGDPGEGGA
jgi:hypothetical protein